MTCPVSTFVCHNLRRLFDNYAVACTEYDALVKSTTKVFSNFVAFSENLNFNCKMSRQPCILVSSASSDKK